MANNRRLLSSESSISVHKAWRNLVDERLKENEMELDMDLVEKISAPTYMYKNAIDRMKHSVRGKVSYWKD